MKQDAVRPVTLKSQGPHAGWRRAHRPGNLRAFICMVAAAQRRGGGSPALKHHHLQLVYQDGLQAMTRHQSTSAVNAQEQERVCMKAVVQG